MAVTEAFIDEIVANEEKYIGIPLCADVRGLLNDRTIGHMYNKATGEFLSAIVGSIIHFEKEVVDGNASLIINARIMKRYKAVCSAVAKLFAEGRLKFSFEIACSDYTELEDGTMLIDASENNYLEGAAIVTFPACEDAVAMELVAECLRKEGENMADQEMIVETAEAMEEVAENEEISEEIETQKVTETAETEETVNAEESVNAEEEMATVIVRQSHEEYDSVNTYDTDTGEETHESISHRVEVCQPVESMAEDNTNKDDDEEEEKEDDEAVDTAAKDKKDDRCETAETEEAQTAEQTLITTIAELRDSINELKSELAAIKEHHSNIEVTAETEDPEQPESEPEVVTADQEKKWTLVNPFTSEMSVPKKYSLLEKDSGRQGAYTLI